MSQVRVLIENIIGGLKRYAVMVQIFRNRIPTFADEVAGVTGGLWNFHVTFAPS